MACQIDKLLDIMEKHKNNGEVSKLIDSLNQIKEIRSSVKTIIGSGYEYIKEVPKAKNMHKDTKVKVNTTNDILKNIEDCGR